MDVFRDLIDFLFPEECVICGKRVSFTQNICEQCERDLLKKGPNLKPEKHKEYLHFFFSYYEDPLRKLILLYKNHGFLILKRTFVLVFEKLFEYFPPPGNSILTWVPSSFRSLDERGFDHMKTIAKTLGKHSKLKSKRLLIPLGGKQKGKGKVQREQERIYICKENLKIKNVVLIDDVVVTGSTIKNSVLALKNSGVERIFVYTLCKSKKF